MISLSLLELRLQTLYVTWHTSWFLMGYHKKLKTNPKGKEPLISVYSFQGRYCSLCSKRSCDFCRMMTKSCDVR